VLICIVHMLDIFVSATVSALIPKPNNIFFNLWNINRQSCLITSIIMII
jgi:hypothetical protein